MGFAGSQGVDLNNPPPFEGEWELRLEDSGAYTDACDQRNWPALLALAVAQGNAATAALAENAVVFCEPEWGFDITGFGNGNYYGAMAYGAPANVSGGLTVAW